MVQVWAQVASWSFVLVTYLSCLLRSGNPPSWCGSSTCGQSLFCLACAWKFLLIIHASILPCFTRSAFWHFCLSYFSYGLPYEVTIFDILFVFANQLHSCFKLSACVIQLQLFFTKSGESVKKKEEESRTNCLTSAKPTTVIQYHTWVQRISLMLLSFPAQVYIQKKNSKMGER